MITIIARVKRIRSRSSGTLQVFAKAEIMMLLGKMTRDSKTRRGSDQALPHRENKMLRQGRSRNLWRADDTTGLFDLLAGGSAHGIEFDGELLAKFAVAEHLDAVTGAIDNAEFAECFFVDGGTVIERLVELCDIDDGDPRLEFVVIESALGQTAVKGHLTAFETDARAAAGACLLALFVFSTCVVGGGG